MIDKKFEDIIRQKYNNIFIVDSLAFWHQYREIYNKNKDLVLTYDLGLYKEIADLNGLVFYLDHIVSTDRMQKNNYLIYRFFKDWHYNKKRQDIFIYKGVPFGLTLRLEYWNDFVAYVRIYLSLTLLESVIFDTLYVASEDENIFQVLQKLNIEYEDRPVSATKETNYYFPIAKWMDEKTRPSGIRAFLYKIRELITRYYGWIMLYVDTLIIKKCTKTVFIQEYFPTKAILSSLRSHQDTRVLLATFSRGTKVKDHLKERVVPIYGEKLIYHEKAKQILEVFAKEKQAKLVLDNGKDISDAVYDIIVKRLNGGLSNIIRTLESCIVYLEKNTVDLEILIANIGNPATVFDAVCKTKQIPSYLIINGLLGPCYLDESKYATVINAYSESIKTHYFKGMYNIVALGDPRMDDYRADEIKTIHYDKPVVTIGASGFNPVDLNSYVAVEFDFLYDILEAFSILKEKGDDISLIVKIRANGYRNQYENFVKKYFSDLDIIIEDSISMKAVLLKSDFYISIYSQTLFEASCLGIPVVYYKKDTEIMDAPFDGKSELVTVYNIEGIVQAFYDFKNQHERYDAFLQRSIMEKYIGPLDGKNLERNMEFIYKLLNKNHQEIL